MPLTIIVDAANVMGSTSGRLVARTGPERRRRLVGEIAAIAEGGVTSLPESVAGSGA